MSETKRVFEFDRATFNPEKILVDNDDEIAIQGIVAREMVQQYGDRYVLKDGDHLEKSAWLLEGRWIMLHKHPDSASGRIEDPKQISGVISNPLFRKDLKDPKTGRPSDKGIQADFHFFKHSRGRPGCTPISDLDIDDIRKGRQIDNSIGFLCAEVKEDGDFRGEKYGFRQINFFYDHVAAPIVQGRCPSPLCGIGQGDCENKKKLADVASERDAFKLKLDEFVAPSKDCEICSKLSELGSVEFSKRIMRTFTKQAVLKALDELPHDRKDETMAEATERLIRESGKIIADAAKYLNGSQNNGNRLGRDDALHAVGRD